MSQVEIRLSLTGKVAITCRASLCTRSNSRKPWDKIRIDYLISTQECGERLRKVLVGVGVGALHAVDEQHVIVPKKIMTVVSSNNNRGWRKRRRSSSSFFNFSQDGKEDIIFILNY